MNNNLIKLKASLCDAINKWINESAEEDENWVELDTSVSDNVSELMTDSAFNILLAQKDLTKYLNDNNIDTP